jgi:transcriptional regulator GlxA family with amidase domain
LTENGAKLEENSKVITDGIFTTAAGAGVSVEFGIELVRVLNGEEQAKNIAEQILL